VIENAEKAANVRDDMTLAIAKDIVYTHHEKWDGTGYPQGLQGADIPIPGRLMALVDVYDAMRSPRPYHGSPSHDEGLALIVAERGKHFDPDVVDAFVRMSDLFRALSEESHSEDQYAFPASRTRNHHLVTTSSLSHRDDRRHAGSVERADPPRSSGVACEERRREVGSGIGRYPASAPKPAYCQKRSAPATV
jgi:hypothetical protein